MFVIIPHNCRASEYCTVWTDIPRYLVRNTDNPVAIISSIYHLTHTIHLNIYIFHLSNLTYTFWRTLHHPQGELLLLALNYLLIVMLLQWLHNIIYIKWYMIYRMLCKPYNNITISRQFWASNKSSLWGWCGAHWNIGEIW